MEVKGIKGYRDMHMTPQAVPSAEEYQAWLDRPTNRSRPKYHNHPYKQVTGVKLRRAVIMRRQGENWKDCANAVGLSRGSSIKHYFEFMPEHLRP
jgi:uncharacterized protein (DUF4415 family)